MRAGGAAVSAPGLVVPRHASPVVAGLLFGAALLTTLGGIALAVAGGMDPVGLPLPLASGAVAFGIAAALLLQRRVELVGVISATAAVGCGVAVFTIGATAGETTTPTLVAGTLWMPGSLIAVSVLGHAVLPTGRALLRAGIAASVVLWAATVAELVLAPSPPGWSAVAAAGWILVAVSGAAALLRQWWIGSGPVRDAAGWLGIAQCAVLLAAIPSYAGGAGLAEVAYSLAATILPGAVILLAAVLLLTGLTSDGAPVDVSLARVIFWVLLAVALVVALLAGATAVAEVAPVTPTTAGMLAVAALALTLEPARRWVQRAVDQLAYGRSAEPAALLRALGEELSSSGDGPADRPNADVLANIASALRRSLKLVWVELASTAPDGVVATAGTLTPASRVLQIPLPGPASPAGTLRVSGVAGGALDRRTRRVLGSISGMLALAVRLADMNREIERARAQIVTIASQEHRLVRSELVDGVVPGVRSARLQLADASRQAAADPRAAGALLAVASRSLQDVTREVRDLARTLLPGALDAGDVAGALAELATRFDRPLIVIDLDDTVEATDSPGLALAYHLIAEVVLGVRRDPGIHELRVGVAPAPAGATITVRIEGDPSATANRGRLLGERARAVGAVVSVLAEHPGVIELRLVVAP